MSVEYENKIIEFYFFVINKKNSFQLAQTRNIDEISLIFSVAYNKRIDTKGTKRILLKYKDIKKSFHQYVTKHYTNVLLHIDETKLVPLLLFKTKTPPRERLPKTCLYMLIQKGGLDTQVDC